MNGHLRKSLVKLKEQVQNKEIVICKSDKDNKILIVNHKDYIKLINQELEKYKKLDLRSEQVHERMEKTKSEAVQLLLKLGQSENIDENLLFHATGYKRNKNGILRKITGTKAKYFANLEPGYLYPLFKTHKIDCEKLNNISIEDIPLRLVIAAGNTYLSKITVFLETILNPISVDYCKHGINEYCKDSSHYIEELRSWKYNGQDDEQNFIITAADVRALYPNIPRSLIKMALKDALDQFSYFSEEGKHLICELTKFCLNNVIIKFQDNFYEQSQGIVTGENNSVSLANIALHYVMKNTTEIKSNTCLLKRYIDDILYITNTEEKSELVKNDLKKQFGKYGLMLTFREMRTKNKDEQVEFLDVLHKSDAGREKNFVVSDFVKPTAKDATFLNGKSFHPAHIFKGIVLGEGHRLRRLNESNEGYQNSLERLKKKCITSHFKMHTITEAFEKVLNLPNEWTKNRNEEKVKNKPATKKDFIPWATSLGSIIKIPKKTKQLVPKAKRIYKRPQTLGGMLTKYKALANDTYTEDVGSNKCGSCGLCGNHGKLKNMVKETTEVQRMDGKVIKLKQNLNCRDYGVYAAQCMCCGDFYVGQTITSFHERWNGHRKTWKENFKKKTREASRSKNTSNQSDENALFHHYQKKHPNKITAENNQLASWYNVAFIEKPSKVKLDAAEGFWVSKLNAGVNIARTIIPKFK